MPNISIIIPHWNGVDVLSECLDSLNKSDYVDKEIIIVDNASSDNSPQYIRENYPDVRLLENKSNRGYAGGCNRGAKEANGNWLVFLNNDTIQEPDWLDHLVGAVGQSENVSAVQPKIRNYYTRNLFDYAGGAGGYMDLFCFPFARGRIFLQLEEDCGQYDDTIEIFWASGTAIMVCKNDFFEAGGFDETFFAHQEEIDLCWRLQLMGKRIMVEPKSLVYHKNAVSIPMFSFQKYYLNHRNSFIMLLSNYNLLLTIYLFPIRLILEFVAMLYAAVKWDWKHVGAILKSMGWITIHLKYISRKRKALRQIRQCKDRELMVKLYRGSIVYAHYIQGVNKYSAL